MRCNVMFVRRVACEEHNLVPLRYILSCEAGVLMAALNDFLLLIPLLSTPQPRVPYFSLPVGVGDRTIRWQPLPEGLGDKAIRWQPVGLCRYKRKPSAVKQTEDRCFTDNVYQGHPECIFRCAFFSAFFRDQYSEIPHYSQDT